MKTSRRNFLKVAGAAIAAPMIIPSSVLGEDAPSKKLTMGCIGMGKQQRGLYGNFMHRVQVLAVCDVDKTRRDDAQANVDKFYEKNPAKGSKGCKAYNDYRELTDRKDIDLVCIAVPDHWHAATTLAALNNGKDVYCEKPLTHKLQEAVDVMRAVEANKRVLQTGSMQRSSKEFRIACELVQNGVIGKIDHVVCSFGGPPKPCDLKEEKEEPGLDWNMWLGAAPMRPYNSVLSPRGLHDHFPNWRSFEEYGTGGVGDWGAHHLDIAQWGLGMDNSGPVEVILPKPDATGGGILKYASGITVHHQGGFGVHFFGADGEVMVNRGQFKMIYKGQVVADTSDKTKKVSCESQVAKAEKEYLKDAKIKLYESKSHTDDFLKCVAERKKPVTSEVVGGHTAICCHLLNIAYKNHKSFKWDPEKFEFVGGTGETKWLSRENPRDPFKK
ncbi:MAG TPA: Gfo/Idh/MocA family oxidoreductase [Planctomycetota bacterium]|jgi:predicted dehydrogenase